MHELTIARMQAMQAAGETSARALVDAYLRRIAEVDRAGPRLNAVIEVNPDAREIAAALDAERAQRGPRGPLHGIPVLLKDNIDTADRMQTSAGSLALLGDPPAQDATAAARLRAAGALILGKTNLSEWANFRGNPSTSGWSGRGGLTRNPYVLDRNPCGSSSGSAAAAAANLCAAALGTETDGSVVCPSSVCGVVGIKPTLGLTSRAGVVPISPSQDTVGIHARTVADAAALLGALTGVDARDPATARSAGRSHADYTQFLDPEGLRGARIGVARRGFTGHSKQADAVLENALLALRAAGAELIDPADVPAAPAFSGGEKGDAEGIVLVYEFKRALNAYLATRSGVPARTLADAVAFNRAHADAELPYFGQELFEQAEAEPYSVEDYHAALAHIDEHVRKGGLDRVLAQQRLDALVTLTQGPAWTTDLVNGDHAPGGSSSPSAQAGYPIVTVPGGCVGPLPVGISFLGGAFTEPTLLRLAYAFEQATQHRRPPGFLERWPE